MKIDIYTHHLPPKFVEAFGKRLGENLVLEITSPRPAPQSAIDNRSNLDIRIELMDKFPGLVQVVTPTGHTIERYAGPDDAAYLSQVYNDELAELVNKYPEKFVAAVAVIPMNNIDAALKEIDRTINELGFKGILVHTPINGKPMDLPEFEPIYERMAGYDLPIWIHPTRHISAPDYVNEEGSKYGIFQAYGWPYETTVAMCRLVCSGIMEKYPSIKLITHHAGAMIPFLAGRIHMVICSLGRTKADGEMPFKTKTQVECFKMFYNDTAINGNAPALMCAHAFFGTEHLLFGTDVPYGPEVGEQFTRNTIDAIETMSIPDADKKKIFEENARALLHLDI